MMNTTGMGIGMWVFWLVTILVIFLIIKIIMSPGPNHIVDDSTSESLLDIFKKHYARGEIGEKEDDDTRTN